MKVVFKINFRKLFSCFYLVKHLIVKSFKISLTPNSD
jgi:hypothetical protein